MHSNPNVLSTDAAGFPSLPSVPTSFLVQLCIVLHPGGCHPPSLSPLLPAPPGVYMTFSLPLPTCPTGRWSPVGPTAKAAEPLKSSPPAVFLPVWVTDIVPLPPPPPLSPPPPPTPLVQPLDCSVTCAATSGRCDSVVHAVCSVTGAAAVNTAAAAWTAASRAPYQAVDARQHLGFRLKTSKQPLSISAGS